MPGASKGKSSSPRGGAAKIRGPVSRVGGRTPGGSGGKFKSPNSGSAKSK